ncbi:hypothetical protein H8958_008168 [Nasalis larvatus]
MCYTRRWRRWLPVRPALSSSAPEGPCCRLLPATLPAAEQRRCGGSGEHHPNYLMAKEHMNLMNMAKLNIKGLVESALNLERTLDSNYAPLQQFFVVMEHCLKQGLKT